MPTAPSRAVSPCGSNVPQGPQLAVLDVLAFVLGKTIKKDRPVLRSIGDDHTKSARSPLAWSRDALLDEAATQIGVDDTALGSRDGLF